MMDVAKGVEVEKRLVEIQCEDETAILTTRSKAATCQGGDHARKRWLRIGAKRHALMKPSFSAADVPLFRRALLVGVTFLDAACIDPSVLEPNLFGLPTAPVNLAEARLYADLLVQVFLSALTPAPLVEALQLLKRDFLLIATPSVRQDSVGWKIGLMKRV